MTDVSKTGKCKGTSSPGNSHCEGSMVTGLQVKALGQDISFKFVRVYKAQCESVHPYSRYRTRIRVSGLAVSRTGGS